MMREQLEGVAAALVGILLGWLLSEFLAALAR